jgi:hypothetical protein
MLAEVSGPSGTASNALRPKRLPIHIGSASERARPAVQSFFVPDQMNRTEPNRRYNWTDPSHVLQVNSSAVASVISVVTQAANTTVATERVKQRVGHIAQRQNPRRQFFG